MMELTQEQINNICKNAFLEGLVAGAKFALTHFYENDATQLNERFKKYYSEIKNAEFKVNVVE